MLGEYPPPQTHMSTPTGPRTMFSRLETLSVSSCSSSWLIFTRVCFPFLIVLIFEYSLFFFIALIVHFLIVSVMICCPCFCSIFIPTKSRFSDSSDGAVFQCLQPHRSNIVHEQWELPLQHNLHRRILLHQCSSRSLWKETEAANFSAFWKWLICILTLLRS